MFERPLAATKWSGVAGWADYGGRGVAVEVWGSTESVYLWKNVNVCRLCDSEMGSYPIMKWNMEFTYIDALTSASCPIDSFTSRSFPPDKAACNSNTLSKTEFIGCLCESAYLTRPMLPFAAVEWRPRWGTGKWNIGWASAKKWGGKKYLHSAVIVYLVSALCVESLVNSQVRIHSSQYMQHAPAVMDRSKIR
jgi:hypothetical protein